MCDEEVILVRKVGNEEGAGRQAVLFFSREIPRLTDIDECRVMISL